MNGIELTQQILERWSDVPVLVMTAYGEIETAVDVLKSDASDYLVNR